MTRKPTRAGMGRSSSGSSAPITHTSWNRTSNRANERPRLASGASRCTSESKASLPQVDTIATVAAMTADARQAAEPGRAEPATTDRGAEERHEHALLGHALAQPRRQHRADQRARRR